MDSQTHFAAAPTRPILLPLDGSALGEHALPTALAIARASGAKVHVVHVFAPLATYVHVPGLFDYRASVDAAFRADGRAYLHGVAARVAAAVNVDVVFDFLEVEAASPFGETDSVVERLLEVVAGRGIGLIVMTTHGRGGLSRAWLGSVADRIIRSATAPVLLVHPRARPHATAAQLFKHVLVPLDGSELAAQIVPHAVALGALEEARITLLRVVIPQLAIAKPAPVARIDVKDLARKRAEAEDYLATTAEPLRLQGLAMETAIIADQRPARAILNQTKQHAADLIAMATHGHGGVKRIMLGSVADKVVRGASTAVLLHRPPVG